MSNITEERDGRKIVYYSDEINDDFARTHIKTQPLPKNFEYYSNNVFRKIRKFFFYRCIVMPLMWVHNKLIRHISYKNKKCMRGYKNRGCFMYGNHTAFVSDAFNPSYIAYPRWADIVVNQDSTSIKGIKWLVLDLGALPIPSDIHQIPKFNDAIDRCIKKKHWIAIYPEAHIWPYYTKLRNFPSVSFRYPVRLNAPVFSYTMTYQAHKHSKKPKMTVYIDGPFFPDQTLPLKQSVQKLRDEVFETMKARCEKYSTYQYKYEYVYRPEQDDNSENCADGTNT